MTRLVNVHEESRRTSSNFRCCPTGRGTRPHLHHVPLGSAMKWPYDKISVFINHLVKKQIFYHDFVVIDDFGHRMSFLMGHMKGLQGKLPESAGVYTQRPVLVGAWLSVFW